MKKILLICLVLIVGGVLLNQSKDCLGTEDIIWQGEQVGRIFSWENSECGYKWTYTSKKGSFDSFPMEELKENHDGDLLLQFAGPFTDEDGTTQGVSVESGSFIESEPAGYSGGVLISAEGGIDIVDFKGSASSYFKEGSSGFEQALVVDNGLVSEQVKTGWNMYKENRRLNYRFLVEDKFGQVRLIDFYKKIGLKDALSLLVKQGYKNVLYLDIVGSELGYYFERGNYKRLGGASAINLYNSKSPGGFLELYFE